MIVTYLRSRVSLRKSTCSWIHTTCKLCIRRLCSQTRNTTSIRCLECFRETKRESVFRSVSGLLSANYPKMCTFWARSNRLLLLKRKRTRRRRGQHCSIPTLSSNYFTVSTWWPPNSWIWSSQKLLSKIDTKLNWWSNMRWGWKITSNKKTGNEK